MMPLEKLKSLKYDMEKNNWVISSFCFKYNNVSYIALVILYLPGEKHDKYALLQIDFIKEDGGEHLLIPANANGLIGDAKTIRCFFNIDYGDKLGDLLKSFYNHLGKQIPSSVPVKVSAAEKRVMIKYLSESDSENPNKIYCYMVKRNPKKADGTSMTRSTFNDNKTKLLRPDLYNKLSKDKTISFCYSDDESKDKTDAEILSHLS